MTYETQNKKVCEQKLMEQYGEGFEMKLYPAGTVIIGDRVFLPEEETERF